MKLALFLLVSLVFNGCNNTAETVVDPREIGRANVSLNTPGPTAKNIPAEPSPVLEIWKEIDGSVPIRGKSLYFRLYDDGAVEFDHEVRRENPSGKPRYIYAVERRPPAKISDDELSRLRIVLEDLTKSEGIKPEYKWVALTLDVLSKLTIILKKGDTIHRKIIVNDAEYDVIHKSFEKKFPRPVIEIIKEAHSIRSRFLGASH